MTPDEKFLREYGATLRSALGIYIKDMERRADYAQGVDPTVFENKGWMVEVFFMNYNRAREAHDYLLDMMVSESED